MAVSALEVVSVANALREGVILAEELLDLVESNADITEAEAELIINENINELAALRDND